MSTYTHTIGTALIEYTTLLAIRLENLFVQIEICESLFQSTTWMCLNHNDLFS